jgi:hypothetical protein
VVVPALKVQSRPEELSVTTLSLASRKGLRRLLEAGSCLTKSAMSVSEEVKLYSGEIRAAQPATRHCAGGKSVYGSPPEGLGTPEPAEA